MKAKWNYVLPKENTGCTREADVSAYLIKDIKIASLK